jgi:predicted helicase
MGIIEKDVAINDFVNREIKWTEELEAHLKKGSNLPFNKERIRESTYRPYVKQHFYFDRIITHRIYQYDSIFGITQNFENRVLCLSLSSRLETFTVYCTDKIPSLGLYVEPTQTLQHHRLGPSAIHRTLPG